MKNIKILSLALAGITLLSAIPVNAYELEDGYSKELIEYQNSEDESFSNETSVFAELKSEYKVTIPKYIVLSGTSKTANYYVKAIGDIAGYERLEVVPDETVSLYSKNKDMQVASISQDKITWHYDDFDIDANGIISAKTITAGKWSGTFNFNINLIDGISEVKVLSDIILPPDEWNGQEVMGTAEFKVGDVASLNTIVDEDVLVTSSNEDVISVENNRLNAVGLGESKITTKLNNKSLTFNAVVVEEETKQHTHTSGNKVIEDKVETTCKDTGSYNEVTYCTTCGKMLDSKKVIIPTTEHNYVNGVCSVCGLNKLPEKKILSDMTFSELKTIAQAGKTEEYGIKVGDQIKVNDNIDAEIVDIGSDYIEFVTVQKALNSNGAKEIVYGLRCDSTASFYMGPRLESWDTNSVEVGYIGSNIQSQMNSWLEAQSDDFKDSLKEVEREYEVATLLFYTQRTFEPGYFSQTTTGTVTDTEKVYIPTKEELEGVYKNVDVFKDKVFWTATPAPFSGIYSSGEPGRTSKFGHFYAYQCGNMNNCSGQNDYGAIAIFRIG